ncbi:MAG: Crp/Fnr family transcriptional regulator [Cytophagaceae bacterium]
MIELLLKMDGIVSQVVTFRKGEVITKIGEIEGYLYILRKGCVKISYYIEEKEYVFDFWFQGDFFNSYLSFIKRAPSFAQIIAITNVEVERISYSQLQEIYRGSHEGSEIGRKMAEKMFEHRFDREVDLITLTAEQRYKKLLLKSQELLKVASVKDIASYLGIHPESLSRIRRRIIS